MYTVIIVLYSAACRTFCAEYHCWFTLHDRILYPKINEFNSTLIRLFFWNEVIGAFEDTCIMAIPCENTSPIWKNKYKYKIYFMKKCCNQCRNVMFKGTMKQIARTKANTQNNTKTRRTPIRNKHLERKNYQQGYRSLCRSLYNGYT